MRIYLAGKWNDKAKIRAIMAALTNRGHTITHDWTHHKEHKKTQEDYEQDAVADLIGIDCAELFIAYLDDPNYAYNGTFTELGFALGKQIPVVIMTPFVVWDPANVAFYKNAFTALKRVRRVATLDEALEV
jgi:nucleoside 2-deoxyribosyltransferase